MPSRHIGVEILVGVARVRIDPGNAEHREALRDRPADEALLGVQVENVELVDPRRHDQQRAPIDLLGRRGILQQFDQVVAEHDLAGRGGHVHAEHELLVVGLADLQIAAARLDVLGEHLHAAREVFRLRRPGRAQEFGIGQQEVRRRHRARYLAQIERRLVMRHLVELRAVDHVVRPVVGDQIGLAQEIEERVVAPVGRGESLVARIGRNIGLLRLAGETAEGVRPQAEQVARYAGLGLDCPFRVGQPVFGDAAEGLERVGDFFRHAGLDLAFLDRPDHRGERLAAVLHGDGEIVGHALEIGNVGGAGGHGDLYWRPGRGRRRRRRRRGGAGEDAATGAGCAALALGGTGAGATAALSSAVLIGEGPLGGAVLTGAGLAVVVLGVVVLADADLAASRVWRARTAQAASRRARIWRARISRHGLRLSWSSRAPSSRPAPFWRQPFPPARCRPARTGPAPFRRARSPRARLFAAARPFWRRSCAERAGWRS